MRVLFYFAYFEISLPHRIFELTLLHVPFETTNLGYSNPSSNNQSLKGRTYARAASTLACDCTPPCRTMQVARLRSRRGVVVPECMVLYSAIDPFI